MGGDAVEMEAAERGKRSTCVRFHQAVLDGSIGRRMVRLAEGILQHGERAMLEKADDLNRAQINSTESFWARSLVAQVPSIQANLTRKKKQQIARTKLEFLTAERPLGDRF